MFQKTLTAGFVHEVQSAESSGQTLRASQSYIVGGISQIIQEYVNFVVARYRPILPWLVKSPRNPTLTISQISCSLGPLGPLGPLVSDVMCDWGVNGSVLVFQMDLGRLPLDFGLA